MRPLFAAIVCAAAALITVQAAAQLSLPSAVDLALRNSPKVKTAQADVDKARATLSEAKDAFVPNINTTGGVGSSSGVPLGVPVIFSISAQSLVFSFSQPDYIRAAHAGWDAAQQNLAYTQNQVAEDVAGTYITLDNALQRKAALQTTAEVIDRLSKIVKDRYGAGLDPHMEVTRTDRTSAQVRLQQLLVDDEIADLSLHLNNLIGTGGNSAAQTVHGSIPEFPAPSEYADRAAPDEAIAAAFATARAREYTAHGDERYLFHPQLAFSAEYSRITTDFSSYAVYYPQFNSSLYNVSRNSLELGIQISVPLLDLVHRAKAKESAADAAHAFAEAEAAKMQFVEGRGKLRRAAEELTERAMIASLDRDLAQDQIDAIELQLKSTAQTAAAAPQLSPEDAEKAHLQERQRFVDMLSADLQLKQTELMLLQQNDALGTWLHVSMPSAASAGLNKTKATQAKP